MKKKNTGYFGHDIENARDLYNRITEMGVLCTIA